MACTFYRQDLFEANTKDFEAEYGYRLEFTKDTTWKNVTDMAAFFKKAKEAGKDVPYGYAQHQGSFAWTTQLDIQRMLFANGRWIGLEHRRQVYGSQDAGQDQLGRRAVGPDHDEVQGAGRRLPSRQPRQRHARAEHGLSVRQHRDADAVSRVRRLDRGRDDIARGRRQDRLCVCPKGEASWIKNGGEAVNGCNCGIGGIGINGNASEDLKRAAYIFAIWSVSRENQFNVLKGLGGTPTRKSVLAMAEVQAAMKRPTTMPNALTFDAVYDYGIKNPHFVLGPKIPQANEYHSILAPKCRSASPASRRRKRPASRSRLSSTS